MFLISIHTHCFEKFKNSNWNTRFSFYRKKGLKKLGSSFHWESFHCQISSLSKFFETSHLKFEPRCSCTKRKEYISIWIFEYFQKSWKLKNISPLFYMELVRPAKSWYRCYRRYREEKWFEGRKCLFSTYSYTFLREICNLFLLWYREAKYILQPWSSRITRSSSRPGHLCGIAWFHWLKKDSHNIGLNSFPKKSKYIQI